MLLAAILGGGCQLGEASGGVAVLLTILQPTEGYINGVVGIFKNQAGGKFWFGVAVIEEVNPA
ncbi:hypothetical protein [Nostoc sp. FACHB-190]|uniref:hypothetical protein n=1 Tax=Nostoc sp. FACHB-190 TaxID=2692838 RepID=UPI00168A0704|nr:hypothetical protein [Nostoc sp. FACHB-190]MBD2303261.1 hypothetical protein [Nostoc sp. FACHB-190]